MPVSELWPPEILRFEHAVKRREARTANSATMKPNARVDILKLLTESCLSDFCILLFSWPAHNEFAADIDRSEISEVLVAAPEEYFPEHII